MTDNPRRLTALTDWQLQASGMECRISYNMLGKLPITESLRAAINASDLSFLALERETGVIRQSLMPFARGESGINIDAADKLAVYFGLELRPVTRKAAKKTTPKRKGK